MASNSTVQPALDEAQSAVSASTARFEQALDELKDRAGKVAQETISTLKSRAEPYVSDAGERLAVAERYIVERVQKQPLTTTLAVLGVGVLVGLVLASGSRSNSR
jgi:ElaB/YqjD/DUF883 family membrane-anchored ribosome-binding protein